MFGRSYREGRVMSFGSMNLVLLLASTTVDAFEMGRPPIKNIPYGASPLPLHLSTYSTKPPLMRGYGGRKGLTPCPMSSASHHNDNASLDGASGGSKTSLIVSIDSFFEPLSVATTSFMTHIGKLKSLVAPASAATIAPPPDHDVAKTMNDMLFHFNKQLIDTVYDIICHLYPVTGTDRDYCRFYVLETVARVPYFAYLSVLHLKETLGQRTIGINQECMRDRMRTHYAEADNEFHHLLIMEELGRGTSSSSVGDDGTTSESDSVILWMDRAVAHSMAFGYFWYVVLVYTANEAAAYHLSELIEDHAYETYDAYLTTYETQLKAKPVPAIARQYYMQENPVWLDLYRTVESSTVPAPEQRLIDSASSSLHETQSQSSSATARTSSSSSSPRVQLNSLYDVFVQIRNDEKEHWKTLCNLVQFDEMTAVTAEHVQATRPTATPAAVAAAAAE